MSLFDTLSRLEEPLFRTLNQAGSNPALDIMFVALTLLGASYVIVWLVPLAWLRGRKELAFDLLVLLVLLSVVVEVLKIVTNRERPYAFLEDVNLLSYGGATSATDPSFPSGHTTRVFAFATLISLRGNRKTWALSLTLAALVGVSRVYLGLHWPSDVLAGILVGIILALMIHWLGGRSERYARARAAIITCVDRAEKRALHTRSGR